MALCRLYPRERTGFGRALAVSLVKIGFGAIIVILYIATYGFEYSVLLQPQVFGSEPG